MSVQCCQFNIVWAGRGRVGEEEGIGVNLAFIMLAVPTLSGPVVASRGSRNISSHFMLHSLE